MRTAYEAIGVQLRWFCSRLGGFQASFWHFSVGSENPNNNNNDNNNTKKIILREFAESSFRESHLSIPKSSLWSFWTRRNFFFISICLGCDFTPLASLPPPAPPPRSRHPFNHKYFNLSIYIHFKTHAQCSLWLWGHMAFIYSSYLFIFLSWGRDVGFYPSALIGGYYRALRASPEWARGERGPREIPSLQG